MKARYEDGDGEEDMKGRKEAEEGEKKRGYEGGREDKRQEEGDSEN